MTEQDRFEIRVGRIRTPSGARKTVSFLNRIERATKRKGRSAARSASSGRAVRPMTFYRRVVVQASFKTHAGGRHVGLKKHVDYIQRDGTDERGGRAEVYGSVSELEGESRDPTKIASDVAQEWKEDRHHFRFVISPEDAEQLADLRSYTSDLVAKMEAELGAKLEWLAADHYNTANPHTHLVVRGRRNDGSDLVIPRRYLAHGMRRQAERLVENELGPVSQIEGRVRMAKTVTAERVTDLDRALAKEAQNGVVDLSGPAPKGRVWHRQLLVQRLRHLSAMGLAERQGGGRWALQPDAVERLRKMGERGDIVKALHRTMQASAPTVVTEDNIFDPNRVGASPVTGVVKRFGKMDDTQPNGFIVIEAFDGRLVHASVAEDEMFDTLRSGQVVTFEVYHKGPRKIDRSIVDFAERNDGIYNEAKHATESDTISRAYAQAHGRRLEALRREKLVARSADGSWRIPADFLMRAEDYEATRSRRLPTVVQRDGRLTLREMVKARGATWLDSRLVGDKDVIQPGSALAKAMAERIETIRTFGIHADKAGRLDKAAIEELRAIDLRDASDSLSKHLQKPYAALENAKRVDGIFRQSVERPSGKFAAVERAKDFTLVPWRPIMERRLGKSISGRVSAGGISWDVTGRQGPSL